ncbi:MAG: hypothetical protein IH908_06970 [Proteobacteria bacterium]|nr:hypothetical protein [Pseudomonadota bacterium]
MLFTFGVLLEALAGAPMAVGIFAGLLVIVVYTMIGGMWAVALTDFIQMLVFVCAVQASPRKPASYRNCSGRSRQGPEVMRGT